MALNQEIFHRRPGPPLLDPTNQWNAKELVDRPVDEQSERPKKWSMIINVGLPQRFHKPPMWSSCSSG